MAGNGKDSTTHDRWEHCADCGDRRWRGDDPPQPPPRALREKIIVAALTILLSLAITSVWARVSDLAGRVPDRELVGELKDHLRVSAERDKALALELQQARIERAQVAEQLREIRALIEQVHPRVRTDR